MKNENIKYNNFLEKIKITKDEIVYLIIVIFFLLTVIVLFFYSTNFEITNINKIFYQNNDVNIETLNRDQYSIVEKKLNLPKNI
ncbi:MAG: hypothetical protein NT068_00590 [Candidatus Nomurabacteria bacterium]|nr:hypothetical protein [Candidatus Nomurabacteria bacterium]